MKRVYALVTLIALTAALLTGCGCDHDWEDATCEDPVTCSRCGETAGDKLGHDWEHADCENPRTCGRCGKERGEALGHTYPDGSDSCSVCGKAAGAGENIPGAGEMVPDTDGCAVEINGDQISVAELNYYYIDTISNFYQAYSFYGEHGDAYLQMFTGLDPTKSVGSQMYDAESGKTWADYFAEQAVENAVWSYVMYDRALAEDFALSQEHQDVLDGVEGYLELYATMYGFASTDEYLKSVYGDSAELDSYLEYYQRQYTASAYAQHYFNGLEYTDDQIRSYEEGRYGEYCSYSYAAYTIPVDHEQADALAMVTLLMQSGGSVDALNEVIAQETDGSDEAAVYTAELYSDLSVSNEEIKKWIASEERKAGDMESFANGGDGNVASYTVVLFLERIDNTFFPGNVRHLLVTFEGGTIDPLTGLLTYSDEEKKVALDEAERLLDEYMAGVQTEEAFTALLRVYTDDVDGEGNPHNDGLYTDITPDSGYVDSFAAWATDKRAAGDVGIIESEFGYHIMYYVGAGARNYRDTLIAQGLAARDYALWEQTLVEVAVVNVKNLDAIDRDYVISK